MRRRGVAFGRFQLRPQREWARGNGAVIRNAELCVQEAASSGVTFLMECPAFDYACCLPLSVKQIGLRDVPFLFRVGRNRQLCVLECCAVIEIR